MAVLGVVYANWPSSFFFFSQLDVEIGFHMSLCQTHREKKVTK